MSPLGFAQQYIGKRATAPGGLGGECVDLCNLWLATMGLPHVYRNAVDWQQPIAGMAWEANDPTNVPPPGAVLVFHPGGAISPFGHVAVCLCADVMHALSVDQGWASDTVGMVIHPYGAVAGWQVHR